MGMAVVVVVTALGIVEGEDETGGDAEVEAK